MMVKEGNDKGISIEKDGYLGKRWRCEDVWLQLITNANAPCNIVTCSSRSDFDFLEIAGNVQKFIDLYGKSAKNCQKSSYDNWLLSYKYIIM